MAEETLLEVRFRELTGPLFSYLSVPAVMRTVCRHAAFAMLTG